MSKLTKSDLKVIVKECLIEILAEGLAEKSVVSQPRTRSKKKALKESILKRQNLHGSHTSSDSRSTNQNRKSYLDNISFNQSQEPHQDQAQEQKTQIRERVAKVTSDPILSEMLADTAVTTLPSQMSAESARRMSAQSGPPADAAARAVQTTPLEDLFGDESSGKWAHLAFGS